MMEINISPQVRLGLIGRKIQNLIKLLSGLRQNIHGVGNFHKFITIIDHEKSTYDSYITNVPLTHVLLDGTNKKNNIKPLVQIIFKNLAA